LKRLQVAVKRVGLALLIGVILVTAKGEAGILDASWTAPTTNTDGSPLTDLASYRLYYSTSDSPCPGPTFVQVASTASSPLPSDTISVQLTGLVASTRYFVAVSAVDTGGGESACSTAANAVARADAGDVQSSPMTQQETPSSAPPSSSASLSATPESTSGEGSITATWANNVAPTPTDWIGLYAEGGAGGSYLAWTYASCSQVPGAAKTSGSCSLRIPRRLQPGRYELRLYAADQFTRLATSNSFKVTSPSSTMRRPHLRFRPRGSDHGDLGRYSEAQDR
jgi:fibronectin type III domain protein